MASSWLCQTILSWWAQNGAGTFDVRTQMSGYRFVLSVSLWLATMTNHGQTVVFVDLPVRNANAPEIVSILFRFSFFLVCTPP
jgi:hypothetical protein